MKSTFKIKNWQLLKVRGLEGKVTIRLVKNRVDFRMTFLKSRLSYVLGILLESQTPDDLCLLIAKTYCSCSLAFTYAVMRTPSGFISDYILFHFIYIKD